MVTTAATIGPKATEEDDALWKRLEGIPKIDLVKHLRAAKLNQDQPLTRIVRELWQLSHGPGQLSPHEYFYYRLYDSSLELDAKRRFVGKRAQARLHAACNDRNWLAVVHDKLLFHATMAGLGFPLPRNLALFHKARTSGALRVLRTPGELERFLCEEVAGAIYAKPLDGMYSLGGYSIDAVDSGTGLVELAFGERIEAAELARRISARGCDGYLFQERLRPHPELAAAFGNRLASLRVIVFLGDEGPELFRAICKIPAGSNIADNFWRPGNLLGAVDLNSGEILRAVSGVGEAQVLHAIHPDTQHSLVGLRIPEWSRLVDLCRLAAAALPGVRTQGWDIAVTETGPVLLEVNFGGDLNLPQVAFGSGVLDERFKQHLRACGYRRPLP
jgi:hypothetical protein